MNNCTKIYKYPEAKGIVVSGDIHSDFKALANECYVQYKEVDDMILEIVQQFKK